MTTLTARTALLQRRRLLAAGLLLPCLQAGAQPAADWPRRPVRLIAPFSAGSTVDAMARLIAVPLADLLGQPVIVENRGGAGGNLGVDAVAKAAPDGYTLGIGTTGPLAINPFLMEKVPFDPVKDFAPVALLANGPNVLVASPALGVRDMPQLLALLKASPGRYSYGSAGVGSTGHLAGELFRLKAGVDIVHVPYKGNQEALTDVIAGQTALAFSGLQPLLPQIQAGRLKALMVAGTRRLATIGSVPTAAEAGLAGAEVMPWYGVIAPARTPPALVEKLNVAFNQIMDRTDIAERFRTTGSEPETTTPARFAELIAQDGKRWSEVIRQAAIKG